MMVYECELLNLNNGTAYIYGINLITAKNSSTIYTFYLYNAHGDVVQLVNGSGVVTKTYHYDAFGVEYNPNANDTNYFRYCGEYFDTETGTYYLRARYYNPGSGRFTSEDTHWNTSNMIYGDEPRKINEHKDKDDKLGLNTYTLLPDVNAITQSENLYLYSMNNPLGFIDPTGENAQDLVQIAGDVAMFDGPLPVGDLIAAGILVLAGGVWCWDNRESIAAGLGTAANWIGKTASNIWTWTTGLFIAANKHGDKTVEEVLKGKKGSIKNAPLPPGGPNWKELLPMGMDEIRRLAQKGEKGFREIWKLLTNTRFDK